MKRKKRYKQLAAALASIEADTAAEAFTLLAQARSTFPVGSDAALRWMKQRDVLLSRLNALARCGDR